MVVTYEYYFHSGDCAQPPSPYEFTSTKRFWILGALIILNGYWVYQQLQLSKPPRSRQTQQEDHLEDGAKGTETAAAPSPDSLLPAGGSPASPTQPQPYESDVFWLQPHITSRPRQILASALGGLVLLLQLVQGSWVLRTAWRMTGATISAVYPSAKPFLIRHCLYLPLAVVVLVSWVVLLAAGLFFVSSQLAFVLRLVKIQPSDPLRVPGEAAR
ncbi:hypothetical protein ACRE_009970 [Hapsidospora chrysogenum ATCC 11550]|uniref:Uncharacterized protein n=1 Tax=Hapsidospora chrysogenum (strain ATCC 11550 / CBS 779.69 / DSM 880 / IAM 14645 / JCM 23072 / IMI 49137) TaxID=857340 RepID=A0A086TFG9_HAPC1|nr:hypothetical protein ACRE_009970 [Hapsidospora chrysogenum ATCC 11550]